MRRKPAWHGEFWQCGGLVLSDLTSSYFEGVTCTLAKLGYCRDSKPGTLQVDYDLLKDDRGFPVAVSEFEGNIGDPKTLLGTSGEAAKCVRQPQSGDGR